MEKMYTLQSDESINDHVKESVSLLNRLAEIAKEVYKYLLDNQVGKLNKELEQEREHSNQLEAQVKVLNAERDLAEQKSEELKRKLNEKYGTDVAYSGYFDTDITHMYPKTTLKPNNPANFCGNCRHYAQMGKDDGDFEGICTQHYIKRVDPDDASCSHFKSNKPDHEVCDNCDKECDDCGYYPF